MTKREILKCRLNMAEQNVLCYSQSQEMETPRPGYAREWLAAREVKETIREMIDELVTGRKGDDSAIIRGTVEQWYDDAQARVCFVKIRDRDGNPKLLEIGREAATELPDRYERERAERKEAGLGERAVFRVGARGLVESWDWAG